MGKEIIMKNKNFCHLHVHDEYSALDGCGTANDFVKRAKEIGFKYLALTNHGNIDGLIKFQNACSSQGIIPILGCESYIIPNIEYKKNKVNGHICLFVKNQVGFNNLCKNLTFANKFNFYYKPRFTFDFLLKNCEGLIISTACSASFVKKFKEGKDFFIDLSKKIKGDLYCEIMPHNTLEQKEINKFVIELAKQNRNKIIATNDCHYVKKKDWKLHEVLLAIQTKSQWKDKTRWKFPSHEFYLKNVQEMKIALEEIGMYKEEYLTNTIEIAKKCCDFRILKKKVQLPKVETLKSKENKVLINLCKQRFKERFGYESRVKKIKYKHRLNEEYELIKEKKFAGYFLIVWKLIDWCNKNEILVGPGRGSVGGSLIAFLLGITTIDPVKNKLLFSRFINQDRIDYPDIDIDFEDGKRHLVLQHLESVYGINNVAGVSSFNRMKAKAVIKDISRVFDIPYFEVNQFTKLIDNKDGGIQGAIEKFTEGRNFLNSYPEVVKMAQKLEGQIRNPSKHAAAFILAQEEIGKDGKCNLSKRGDSFLVNWEKEDTEFVGLMKLDILGLKMLSILSETLKLVQENYGVSIELNKVDYEDKKVLKSVNMGNTIGLFQFGTWVTSQLISKVDINCFQDLCDVIALVRPGPTNSGMTKQYIERKAGQSWEKKNIIYEKITKDTQGIIIYQEQVMQVINQIAGLPYTISDKVRKIIGKKRNRKEFLKYKKMFLGGCKKTKIFTPVEAKDFWEGLQEWAVYGFNKSHSVGYAMLGMWSAHLKYYYPTEFLCSSLTFGSKDKKNELIEEAYRLNLKLILPKIGVSDAIRWIAREDKLFVPFQEVKGLGKVKSQMITEKENRSIYSFFSDGEEEQKNKFTGSLNKVLQDIGAYTSGLRDIEILDSAVDYFDFRLNSHPADYYKNLFSLFEDKEFLFDHLTLAINGDIKLMKKVNERNGLFLNKKSRPLENLKYNSSCTDCFLKTTFEKPASSKQGKTNIFIILEYPEKEEIENGKLFSGKCANKVIKELKDFDKDLFYWTYTVKCHILKNQLIKRRKILECGKLFLEKEILKVKPKIILSIGSLSMNFLAGQKSGLNKFAGKTIWNEKYGCWVVYCINPISLSYNNINKFLFEKSMSQFKKILRAFKL